MIYTVTYNPSLDYIISVDDFLIKPNNHELGEIFGVTIEKREEVEPYAGKLQEMGARNVLVSMAGEGAVLLDEKNGGGFGVCQCVFRGSGR